MPPVTFTEAFTEHAALTTDLMRFRVALEVRTRALHHARRAGAAPATITQHEQDVAALRELVIAQEQYAHDAHDRLEAVTLHASAPNTEAYP